MQKTKTIRKILIANRGEIVLRVIRTIKELGLSTVVAFKKPDRDAYFIRYAEEAIEIGEGPIHDYLHIEKMIRAAQETGADAIHPGYGFLSENPEFAEACEKAGITFIGPPSWVLRYLSDKAAVRHMVQHCGVPTIPGTELLSAGEKGLMEAMRFGKNHDYPLMIKAAAGGGGRGVRRVQNEMDLLKHLIYIRSQSRPLWDEGVFIEKSMDSVRHIEIPILADQHGSIIHLGSLDGSIQRRHQKLVEIAPANLAPELLDALYWAAVRVVRAVGYVNAGSLEFLVNPESGEFWFMTFNRRLTVEHPATEELTNVDIVREQIRIAEGHRLLIPQERIKLSGKAIQVRINAEDPLHDFRPEGEKTVELYLPPGGPGIRLDGIVYQGYRIPAEYDPLLVKLTVRGYDWEQATSRLRKALDSFVIVGPQTTIPFHRTICSEPDFRDERMDTHYIQKHPHVFQYSAVSDEAARLEAFFMEQYAAEFLPDNWL
ncbi:MAG TPA: biotin carboxylase N-terminal domain-containing protein [Syntrophales bacterium]|nr:biotin carboxylase N-terminal domain-containing protein [Syntrophales bacterium]